MSKETEAVDSDSNSDLEQNTTLKATQTTLSNKSSKVTTFALNKENKRILAEMIDSANKKEFPKKEFIVSDKTKLYTSYLHFFESQTTVNDSEQKLAFKCIFCSVIKNCCIGATSNLLAHLKLHVSQSDELNTWLKAHCSMKIPSNKIILDKKIFKLLKYFISSNTAASHFDYDFSGCKPS